MSNPSLFLQFFGSQDRSFLISIHLFFILQTVHHGFPNKPTALAWDPKLRIAAVGTATGAIKMYATDWILIYAFGI